ncbi:MAG: polysaccharide deacetylase family protein [Bacillota bacterium]|nr:polysaccharide deacetylase family protein [Bacillota bacterium]
MNKRKLFFLSILIFICCIIVFYHSILNMADIKYKVPYSNNVAREDLQGRTYKKITITKIKDEKIAFLTFDDGPCLNNTLKILNILNENNIKATFFVVGKQIEKFPVITNKMVEKEMSVMPHSYSHEYKKIYKSIEAYKEDLERCCSVIENITGQKSGVYVRVPGGANNRYCNKAVIEAIRETIREKDMFCVDWNVSGGDAVAGKIPAKIIKDNVLSQCEGKKIAVILLHDAYYKDSTVEALPDIIRGLKEEGYKFKTFNDITLEERKRLMRIRVINV